jgi:hypothetical protein
MAASASIPVSTAASTSVATHLTSFARTIAAGLSPSIPYPRRSHTAPAGEG